MNTYLLTWNPKQWDEWDTLPVEAIESAAGKKIGGTWSCYAHTKDIQIGDRVFLIRLGKAPKGIIASGWVTAKPKLGDHWDEEKAAVGKKAFYVDCEWERLLNPDVDAPLALSELKSGKLAKMHWTPQFSGSQILDEVVTALEEKWAAHVGKTTLAVVSTDTELSAMEGAEKLALVRHRKREQSLRDAKVVEAIKSGNGKLKCEVPKCGFDFEITYGELGRNYAQVHHLKQLGDRTNPSRTKLVDLAVVCANCHAMIHRGGKCRPLDKLIP